MATSGPPDEEVLRKFYRAYYKHGPSNWAKVAKETRLSVEQCEALHKQHTSFLSLPSSPALEVAFIALVKDHYNATRAKKTDQETPEDDAGQSAKPNARGTGEEEPDVHVATSTSQKPKRTPKPTPQRLAAEEEAAARRLARSQQGTPKSARAIQRGPPSPTAGDWPSSQRKRNRRLFEDNVDLDAPRYRSPTADRWRGRHNTDVDEGVDALLSLASGAHATSTNLDERVDERPGAADTNGDVDGEVDGQDAGPSHDTPKRARGARGARSTPTLSGTPGRNGARAAAFGASDAVPVPSLTGLRSPRSRVGTAAAAAAAATAAAVAAAASGRGAASGRQRTDKQPSPTTSSQIDEGNDGASAAAAPETSDAGPGAPSPSEGAAGTAAADAAAGRSEGGDGAAASPGPVNAAGRPVRRRKPSALAIAAAAAVEEDESGSKLVRSEVAAMAAALGATAMSEAAHGAMPGFPGEGVDGAGAAMDVATTSLLAGVPPVKTRVASRANSSGPGSRRAMERSSPVASLGAEAAMGPAEDEAEAGTTGGDAAAGPATAEAAAAEEPGQSADPAAEINQEQYQAPVRPRNWRPPPGRTRRRKSLPERLPPMWEPLPVPPRVSGAGVSGSNNQAPSGVDAAEGTVGPSGAGLEPRDAEGAANASGAREAEPGKEAASTAPMPALEVALRHCLGTRVRRWCNYEFMYSAIDRPWFMRNELLEFGLHLQLPTTKLTRLEWSVLRGALGRPRRLSLAFLREERLRLEGYREHARLKYEEVAQGFEVPPELPRQLRVGQEVTARHPGALQLHDGVVLTVKGSKYRVQFHRSHLRTEVIRDTDVMPLDPHECMPLAVVVHPMLLNGRPYDPIRLAESRGLIPPPIMRPQGIAARPLGSWATGLDTQLMRDADSVMIQEVQRALEVKEGLVARLTQLNTEAAAGMHATDDSGSRSEHFQLQYTNVVLQLKETNAVLEAALTRLNARQQQVLNGSGGTALGAALMLQQQQQATAVAGLAPVQAGPPGADGALSQPLHSQQPMATAPSVPPQALTPPTAPSPAPSPTAPVPGVVPGQQLHGGGRPPVPVAPTVHPPIIVPPPRPSAAPSSLGVQSAQAPAMLTVTSAQLVEQALAEARAVVRVCRGKTTEPIAGQPVMAASASGARPLVAPALSMQTHAPNGGSLPLAEQQSAPTSKDSRGATGCEAGLPADMALTATDGDGAAAAALNPAAAVAAIAEAAAPSVRIKTEDGALVDIPSAAASAAARAIAELQALSEAPGTSGRSLTEEELSESWLRDVIVGCVGVLFTIQKCTAGNVPPSTVAEALNLAVQQLQIKTNGENENLYRDIVQSVQGLRGHLTRALA